MPSSLRSLFSRYSVLDRVDSATQKEECELERHVELQSKLKWMSFLAIWALFTFILLIWVIFLSLQLTKTSTELLTYESGFKTEFGRSSASTSLYHAHMLITASDSFGASEYHSTAENILWKSTLPRKWIFISTDRARGASIFWPADS